MSSLPPPTIPVHGLPMVDLSPTALSDLLEQLLLTRRGTTILTPNAFIGAACDRDPALHELLCSADLLLPDGAGVVMASRRQGQYPPLHYRLPGIDAGETVLRLCAKHGLPVYFLGGQPGVAAAAGIAWQQRLPALPSIYSHHGYFDSYGLENEDIRSHIRNSGAAVLFVCLGFPRQERWIMENRSYLPDVRLLMGLGGSLDVWAGNTHRAPTSWQTFQCEWLWRMLCQPQRFAQLPSLLRYIGEKHPFTTIKNRRLL